MAGADAANLTDPASAGGRRARGARRLDATAPPPTGAARAEREKLRLGGMALRNGLLIHGPTSWARGRARQGRRDRRRLRPEARLRRQPLRQGADPARPAAARRGLRGDPDRPPRAAVGAPAVRGPARDRRRHRRRTHRQRRDPRPRRRGHARCARRRLGALGLAPALVALSGSELAAYHAVEHKAIAGYEQDRRPGRGAEGAPALRLQPDRPDDVFSLAGQLIVDRLVENPGRIARGGQRRRRALALGRDLRRTPRSTPTRRSGRAVHAAGDTIQRALRHARADRGAARGRRRRARRGARGRGGLSDHRPICRWRSSWTFAAQSRSTRRHPRPARPVGYPLIFADLRRSLLVYVMFRMLAVMPKTKPQEIKASKRSGVALGRHRRRRGDQGRAARGRRVPLRPEALQGARGQGAEGDPAARPARHRQDDARQGGRPRVGRQLLQPVGLLVRRDVRRPRRGPDQAPVQGGARQRAGDPLHRRARRRRRRRAAATSPASATRR